MMRSPRRYESAGRGPPMRYASSACSTCSACASMDEWTATVRIASRRQEWMTRQAISPRLAIRILLNMRALFSHSARRGSERTLPGAEGVLVPHPAVAHVDRSAVAEHDGPAVVGGVVGRRV